MTTTHSHQILIMPADILSGAPADTADTSGHSQRTPADTLNTKPRKSALSQRTFPADAADTPSGHRPPHVVGDGSCVGRPLAGPHREPFPPTLANTHRNAASWAAMPTLTRSRYTPQQRAQAIDLAVETHSITEAAERTDIPASTIRNWLTPEQRSEVAAHTRAKTDAARAQHQAKLAERRAALRVKLLERAERMLDRMTEPETDYRGQQAREVTFPEASPISCKALATSAAILIDKLRLELGEVTDRTETRTVDQVAADIEDLTRQMAERSPA